MKMQGAILWAVSVLIGCEPDAGPLFNETGASSSSDSSSSSGEASGDSSSSSKGSGGEGTAGSGSGAGAGSGGGSCTPTVTCLSVGAECGMIQDDGCGNVVDCGDSCQTPFVCGGGGDQYKCGCSPLSCTDQGFDCGMADDGCGNQINCGQYPTDPNRCEDEYELCGKGEPLSDGSVPPGAPNVCGGGCVEAFANPGCSSGTNLMLVCAAAGNSAPEPGCLPGGNSNQPGWNGELPSRVWCCP